jgi:hypothetical protein
MLLVLHAGKFAGLLVYKEMVAPASAGKVRVLA